MWDMQHQLDRFSSIMTFEEIIFRITKGPQWLKLIQDYSHLFLQLSYVILIISHLTAIVLIALAIALFYQSKRSLLHPGKSPY